MGGVYRDTRKFLSPRPTFRAGCTKRSGDWQEKCFGVAVEGGCYLNLRVDRRSSSFLRGLVVSDNLFNTKYIFLRGAQARGS